MAALPPPALGSGGLILAVQLSTFFDYYADVPQIGYNQQYDDAMPVSPETNSTCKLTVLRVKPRVTPPIKLIRIITCSVLTKLHDVIIYLRCLN
jgi:hypothetical protein